MGVEYVFATGISVVEYIIITAKMVATPFADRTTKNDNFTM